MRATNAPIAGDTFAPISRLLGEVLAARLVQVSARHYVYRVDACLSPSRARIAHRREFQVLPHVCSDMLDAAMPILTSAALRLGQVMSSRSFRCSLFVS